MESFKNLRDWLKEIEKMGELKTINEEVDWDEELSAITYMVAKNHGSPALLFENIKDYPQGYRVLSNIFGSSLRRIGYTGDGPPPIIPAPVVREVSKRCIASYKVISGQVTPM